MKIALVDDEEKYITQMDRVCREYMTRHECSIETFPFTDGAAFLDALSDNDFSIVFMDIYMGETDGISIARRLRERDTACVLVFLTGSREFMPEAFSCHAFEYLSKPISYERVEKVLDDALRILPQPQKYVELACERKNVRVFLRDIVFVTSDAHYLEVLLSDGTTLRCRMTMTAFTQLVANERRFVLVNRGVLLNAEHLLFFDNGSCVMDNGKRLPIRVRDARRVEQEVRDYNFNAIRLRQSAANGRG